MSVVVPFASPVVHSEPFSNREVSLSADPLAGAISALIHDFNNLITGILLYTELLSNELPPGEKPHNQVQQIRKAAENTTGLIRQLLAIARPEPSPFIQACWNRTIAEIFDLLQRMAGENVEIITQLDEELSAVGIGPTEMQRILLNLVLNARDAMADGGRILIQTRNYRSTRKNGAQVELSVEDDGNGMDEEICTHLFEPFRTSKNSGTGLGLYSVRRLVQQHGGQLHVESSPGKGTRVTIQLPRAVQLHKKSECKTAR